MSKAKIISWQKYEDVIEEQLKSPLIDQLLNARDDDEDDDDDEKPPYIESEGEHGDSSGKYLITIPENIANEISLVSNFSCWLAHTNFTITREIKDKLNKIEGVELLKVCSRYRFVIGVGKLFEFSDVRQRIERELT